MTNLTFAELSLSDQILTAVTEMGFTEATEVQAEAIPLIRTGVDVLARSQTGTGKTVAFGIPAVESIVSEDHNVQVLILSPTRELSQQCGDEIRKIARHLPHVKTADIYGGSDFNRQFKALRTANLVIGTPGRVMDHMRRGTLKLDHLKMIVLDEADEMLNMGFKEDIETILVDVPEERQIVLFSATVPAGILAITKQFQRNPVHVDINRNQMTIDNIEQTYVDVPMYQKVEALKLLMHFYKPQRAIVFANTKSMVDELVEMLRGSGFSAEGLHGDMKQMQRTHVMQSFKKGRVNILVATDVAARGIDVSDVDYVFNYDIPKMSEYYVHRIGRTGRAGRSGTSVTLCCGKRQIVDLQRMVRRFKANISAVTMPTIADIERSNLQKDLDIVRKALSADAKSIHTEMVAELVAEGFTGEQLASALLGLAFKNNTAGLINLKATPKVSFKSERDSFSSAPRSSTARPRARQLHADLVISMGSANRVSPNHLIGAITECSGIDPKSIGQIDIASEYSIVGVPADQLDEILLTMQGCKIYGKPVTVVPFGKTQLERPVRAERPRFNGNRGGGSGGSKPFNKGFKKRS